MKYAVLGAGLMGKAFVYDLLQQNDTDEVILADKNQHKLSEAAWMMDNPRLRTEIIDANNPEQVRFILDQVDAAVGAIHYEFNLLFTRTAISTGMESPPLVLKSSAISESWSALHPSSSGSR